MPTSEISSIPVVSDANPEVHHQLRPLFRAPVPTTLGVRVEDRLGEPFPQESGVRQRTMNQRGTRTRKGMMSRKGAGKDSQDLEIEWLWGNEGEGMVKGG